MRRVANHLRFALRRPRRGLSLTEMMIAIVILGIGLLMTSSMFPIAWYKARDVAEATSLQTSTDAAEVAVKFLCRVNGPPGSAAETASSFWPGDWFADTMTVGALPWMPACYPDTHVHHLNAGNYLFVGLAEREQDWLSQKTTDLAPVGDNTWELEDNLLPMLRSPLTQERHGIIRGNSLHHRKLLAHSRLIPMMDPQPKQTNPPYANWAVEMNHWRDQFSGRRYCWSVFYRFTELPGPDGGVEPFNDPLLAGCATNPSLPQCSQATRMTRESLERPRLLTLYVFTLKRPEGARYARQQGYTLAGNDWNNPPADPRALSPDLDVVLPVPWRVEAWLRNPPASGAALTGLPSEIDVNGGASGSGDPPGSPTTGGGIIARMLPVGASLLDDRTGQIYRVTARRENPSNRAQVTLTLDKEYAADEIHVEDYEPFPTDAEFNLNWQNNADYWACVATPTLDRYDDCDKQDFAEDKPAQRFYWVFPPPVDATDTSRPGGVPLSDGSSPVVGVEVRQMTIAPRTGS